MSILSKPAETKPKTALKIWNCFKTYFKSLLETASRLDKERLLTITAFSSPDCFKERSSISMRVLILLRAWTTTNADQHNFSCIPPIKSDGERSGDLGGHFTWEVHDQKHPLEMQSLSSKDEILVELSWRSQASQQRNHMCHLSPITVPSKKKGVSFESFEKPIQTLKCFAWRFWDTGSGLSILTPHDAVMSTWNMASSVHRMQHSQSKIMTSRRTKMQVLSLCNFISLRNFLA